MAREYVKTSYRSHEKTRGFSYQVFKEKHNFYYGGCYGVNAYDGSDHGHGNFTPRRYDGIGNFSSHAKSYGHTSYDDYVGHKRVNVRNDHYEHSYDREIHDESMQ
ncbi:hypothetical protein M9H77_16157 [Catharanthus roseus]|uniref:Uncharacterized protein n=1 Tax=Catharanthus roseus TaxID=4058 RepID=A0ACC0B097_CATRO|nr:hypothetical protein M9H77_16157 [Catharanthus roseus]